MPNYRLMTCLITGIAIRSKVIKHRVRRQTARGTLHVVAASQKEKMVAASGRGNTVKGKAARDSAASNKR